MTTERTLYDAVRAAWASVPAPSEEDMKLMEWGWGEAAARAFTGVAPVEVDLRSHGFHAATPLMDLPPRAAAAYLGTFVLALLLSLERQKAIGIYADMVTRAHIKTCLTSELFWQRVVRPYLSPPCRAALAQAVSFFASEAEALALTPEQVEAMRTFAADAT